MTSVCAVFADTTDSKSSALLPERIGKFRKVSGTPGRAQTDEAFLDLGLRSLLSKPSLLETRGQRSQLRSLSFARMPTRTKLLSLRGKVGRSSESQVEIQMAYGTAGFASQKLIAFFKGTHFVSVRSDQSP